METLTRKDTHPPVFTAALFTAAKTWEHPACPSAGEWIKKHRYAYSAVKENETMPNAAARVDLEVIIVSEVSQTKTSAI